MLVARRSSSICLFCQHAPGSLIRPSRPPHTSRTFTTSRSSQRGAQKNHTKKTNPNGNNRTGTPPRGTNPRGNKHGRAGRFNPLPSFARPAITEAVPLRQALSSAFNAISVELKTAPITAYLEKEGIPFEATFEDYEQSIHNAKQATDAGNTFYRSLEEVYVSKGREGLDARLKHGFYAYVTGLRFTDSDIRNQKAVADLRYPVEWFPGTRQLQRKIHLHVGPTNSGKTYHALKSLEAAMSGMYAGPLRLLAHEVYTRMNAKGKPCILVTGEERRAPPADDDDGPKFAIASSTVEMVDLNKKVDVAVIDEIQMLGDPDRGWAWTQALLGVQATEVHLCGELRTVPIIQEICALVGETPIVHKYERLSPLQMDKASLEGNLKNLRKGDCIVSFSVMGIHALRQAIEKQTKKKVAIVYGGLPPETRAQQARLFNDPDNDYDYLVASDAIGMGLNLSIKRIIFETTDKFNGQTRAPLLLSDLKQIAGRAGRYRTAQVDTVALEDLSAAKGESVSDVNLVSESGVESAEDSFGSLGLLPTVKPSMYEKALSLLHPGADPANPPPPPPNDPKNFGLVTTLEKQDYRIVEQSLRRDAPPIKTAGLLFPAPIIDRFAQCFPPGTPFSYVMLRLSELSQLNPRFHLCGLRDQLWVADTIEPVRGLSIDDRVIFSSAPVGYSDRELWSTLLPAFARCVEQQSGGALHDIAEIPLELLEEELVMTRPYLRSLETLHKAIVGYLWLSFRFAGVFSTRALAEEVKRRTEERIELVLTGLSLDGRRAKKMEQKKAKAASSLLALESNAEQQYGDAAVVGGQEGHPQPSALGTEEQLVGEDLGESSEGQEDRIGHEVAVGLEEEADLVDTTTGPESIESDVPVDADEAQRHLRSDDAASRPVANDAAAPA